MKRIFSTLVLLLISIPFTSCKNHTSVDSYIEELVADGNFNGNVLVIKNGETLYEASFGYSDGTKTVPLTKDFRFGLGSVFKEFPAVAIMQLQEKELLHVDDKIDKYLKDLPNWASKVSIKNLLQYTSGLPKVPWEKYIEKDELMTDEKVKKDLQHIEELDFEPGDDYLYTNYSPIVLSRIVEEITQQKFNDYVVQNLFLPFSLDDAVIPTEVPFLDRNLMAIPFDEAYEEDSYRIAISGVIFCFTARDLYRWIDNLHAFKIINQKSVKLLSEKADFFGNIQAPLGFVEWKDNKIIEHSHHGENGNYECFVRRFTKEKDVLTIIVQSNQKRGNVVDITEEIRDILNFD
ncbi:beta-lactamase family protein [Aquimarina sp. D1M17]|uniref:serine hydrolase domain-containing protein n=1 Tax=Aquimarina acroporae TaxID=2937283 RepID=UPI0020C00B2D|nr:serine hydrolase domain-containing protein [Aquimarina acroporae]MCK8521931.1 beta-lactamase family protein [Aquimarina acroporae]